MKRGKSNLKRTLLADTFYFINESIFADIFGWLFAKQMKKNSTDIKEKGDWEEKEREFLGLKKYPKKRKFK